MTEPLDIAISVYRCIGPTPPGEKCCAVFRVGGVVSFVFADYEADALTKAKVYLERMQERALKSEAAKHARRGGRAAQALKRRQTKRAEAQEGDRGEGGP